MWRERNEKEDVKEKKFKNYSESDASGVLGISPIHRALTQLKLDTAFK